MTDINQLIRNVCSQSSSIIFNSLSNNSIAIRMDAYSLIYRDMMNYNEPDIIKAFEHRIMLEINLKNFYIETIFETIRDKKERYSNEDLELIVMLKEKNHVINKLYTEEEQAFLTKFKNLEHEKKIDALNEEYCLQRLSKEILIVVSKFISLEGIRLMEDLIKPIFEYGNIDFICDEINKFCEADAKLYLSTKGV